MANRQGERLPVVVDEPTAKRLDPRHVLEDPFQPGRIGTILTRQKPVARALEHEQAGGLLGHLGDELDGARTSTNHRDPLTAQVVLVVPTRRVEAVTFEWPLEPRRRGLVQLTGGNDQGLRLPAAPI